MLPYHVLPYSPFRLLLGLPTCFRYILFFYYYSYSFYNSLNLIYDTYMFMDMKPPTGAYVTQNWTYS